VRKDEKNVFKLVNSSESTSRVTGVKAGSTVDFVGARGVMRSGFVEGERAWMGWGRSKGGRDEGGERDWSVWSVLRESARIEVREGLTGREEGVEGTGADGSSCETIERSWIDY
jgi:hypothetical protein